MKIFVRNEKKAKLNLHKYIAILTSAEILIFDFHATCKNMGTDIIQ